MLQAKMYWAPKSERRVRSANSQECHMLFEQSISLKLLREELCILPKRHPDDGDGTFKDVIHCNTVY